MLFHRHLPRSRFALRTRAIVKAATRLASQDRVEGENLLGWVRRHRGIVACREVCRCHSFLANLRRGCRQSTEDTACLVAVRSEFVAAHIRAIAAHDGNVSLEKDSFVLIGRTRVPRQDLLMSTILLFSEFLGGYAVSAEVADAVDAGPNVSLDLQHF